MTTKEKSLENRHRLLWMDNLRTFIIFLVVLYHVGGVYESAGLWGWFWIVDDPATITWVGIMGIVFDIFMMPTIFFLSGYFASNSIKRKSGWAFIKEKLKRLMVPWAIAVATLIPIYKVIFLYSRNLPQEHWSTYFHITNPNSQNWLWFLPVLFMFNILYLLISRVDPHIARIPIKVAILGAFFIGGLYSFSIGGILGFRSWTLTPLIDFENERLLIYFMAFILGALCFLQNGFNRKPQSKRLYTVISSIAWIPITIHIFARLFPFFYPEGFTVSAQYRLIWWISFHLSLVCMLYLMLETFRRYFDKTGKIWNELSRNSYGVYIIHVIVIGGFGTLLLNTNLPALAKYLTLIVLTYFVSNLIISVYRFLFQTMKSRTRQRGILAG